MFRPLTVVAIAAFSLVGWHVYRAEEAATQLDREMRDLNRRIEQARERTQVLRAEWAMLNEPERLRQVAQRHLTLETMTPDQFVRMAELERRLPQAVAFAGPVSLFGSAPEVAVAAATPAAPQPATQGAAPAAAPPPPAAARAAGAAVLAAAAVGAVSSAVAAPRTAAETHHRPAAPRLAETPRAEPAIRPTPVSAPASSLAMAASRAEAPRRAPAPASAPAPAPRAAVAAPAARQATPAPAQVPLLRAAHVPAPRPLAPPVGGSALGMAGGGGLAPPVPLAAPVPVSPGAWRQ